MSNKGDYGYFGEGFEGYMHYLQAFNENFSSDTEDDYSSNRFDDSDDDWLLPEEEDDSPIMSISGDIYLCPGESEVDFMMMFERFLAENGWSFDGLTMDN